jgi:hypothetical protein
MDLIAGLQQSARIPAACIEHFVSIRIGRFVRDTVLRSVDIDSLPHLARNVLLSSATNNFLDRKLGPVGLFAMQECRCDEDLNGAGYFSRSCEHVGTSFLFPDLPVWAGNDAQSEIPGKIDICKGLASQSFSARPKCPNGQCELQHEISC